MLVMVAIGGSIDRSIDPRIGRVNDGMKCIVQLIFPAIGKEKDEKRKKLQIVFRSYLIPDLLVLLDNKPSPLPQKEKEKEKPWLVSLFLLFSRPDGYCLPACLPALLAGCSGNDDKESESAVLASPRRDR